MSYLIGDIEDGILTTLQASAMGSYCQQFETWGGSVEELIAKRTLRTPACYAAFAGGDLEDTTGGGQDTTAVFSVIVFARNLRGEAAARRGGPGATEVGAYEMIEHARAALHKSDLGLSIDRARVVRIRLLDVGATYAAYAVDVEVLWHIDD